MGDSPVRTYILHLWVLYMYNAIGYWLISSQKKCFIKFTGPCTINKQTMHMKPVMPWFLFFYFLISLDFQLSIDFVTSDCTPKVKSRRVEILLTVYAFVLLILFYAYFLFAYNALSCIHDVTFLLALNNCLKFDCSPRPGNMTCKANNVMNRCLL